MTCIAMDYAYLRKVVLEESAEMTEAMQGVVFEVGPGPLVCKDPAKDEESLVELLRIDRMEHLHRAIAEAMTLNETSFFRDVWPFEMLWMKAVPELMAQQRKERTLRIWSAACSTGQEVYSVAMLLLEHFPELEDWDVKIFGSDNSRTVLEYAVRGRYRRGEVNRGLPAKMLTKYFTRYGDEWEVSDRVRALCEFRLVDLCAPVPELPVFDLVLLRNVLLYLAEQDRGGVLAGVHKRMSSRGFLLLGSSEQAEDSTDLFEMESAGDSYYYRPRGF